MRGSCTESVVAYIAVFSARSNALALTSIPKCNEVDCICKLYGPTKKQGFENELIGFRR